VLNVARQRDRQARVEWAASGGHLIEHHAQSVDVCSSVHFLTPQLFWGHVGERPYHSVRLRQALGHRRLTHWRHQLSHPKIQHLRVSTIRHEQVRRLDVAMNDPFLVCGVQCVGYLTREVQQLAHLKGLNRKAVLEGLPFQVLHHDERLTLVFIDAMNGADVGVIQR